MAEPTNEVISWPALIVLMAFGAGQDLDRETVRGTVRVRETTALGDEDETEFDWIDTVEQHPVPGRLGVVENEFGLLVRGASHRMETVDGRALLIETPHSRWWIADGVARHQDPHFAQYTVIGGPQDLLDRPQPSRWEGTDFARPAGPITAVEFLGRPAWAVEIAPPGHKPYPRQLVVDAATGRVLSDRNDGFTEATEWTSVEFGVDLGDELFTWDGPVRADDDDDDDDPQAEYEQQRAADLAWLAERGLTGLVPPLVADVHLHDHDDTGVAYLGFGGEAELQRRPRSDEPWPSVDALGWTHVRRWSDERWDWCLAGERPIDEAAFAGFAARLATTT